jgi:hypothetical protein
MRAWLQGYNESRLFEELRVSHSANGVYFGVRSSEYLVVSLSDNLMLVDEYRPDHGIRHDHAPTFRGEGKGVSHVGRKLSYCPHIANRSCDNCETISTHSFSALST